MTDRIDWDRLARYASGEAGADERAEVDRWAASSPENREALDSVNRGWDASVETTAWDADAAWERFAHKVRNADRETKVVPIETGRRWSWFRPATFVPIAAAAALVLAIGLQLQPTGSDPVATVLPAGGEIRTAVGEQSTFKLPDGSEVVLGAASSLRIGTDFGATSRDVVLEGQAFVRVTHDEARPFVVTARGTRTVDLGTAFEVRAYPNQGVRVVVTEGSVEVRRETGSTTPAALLQAGDVAQLPEGRDAVVLRQQDVTRLLGWTRGELTFDDATLADVSQELERWYDVDFRIDDTAIESLHLSAQWRIGESLDEVLRVMEFALSAHGVRAQRDGRTVTLKAGAPAVPPARRAAVIRSEVGA